MAQLLTALQAYVLMQRVAVPELCRGGERVAVVSSLTARVQMLVDQLFKAFGAG
jgi:hypothetical protein